MGHRNGEFEVALLAASASENNGSKEFPGNAKVFKDRVDQLRWNDLPIVLMPAIAGLSYFDFCFWVEDTDRFELKRNALWKVIAPNIEINPQDHLSNGKEIDDDTIQSPALYKWRNTWCDVMSAYSHIHEGRDVFITNNTKDFQKNASALAELGMKYIFSPQNARILLTAITTI